ncbi:MAG: FAD:protein FMN transferase [Myxococcota bacterium]
MTRALPLGLVALVSGVCLVARIASGDGEGATAAVVELSGDAFGTTWHVRLAGVDGTSSPEEVSREIRAALDAVDVGTSSWRNDSEIARFNRSPSTAWQAVSPDTAAVAAVALEVHRRSEGAFDPTVAPLVALWGFGSEGPRPGPPTPEAVSDALARVGSRALGVRGDPPALRKARPDLTLDLSAVAKGYAVDAVARRLDALGVGRFLVEIGGELRARGEGPGGGPWRVGIERPEPGPSRIGWTLALADASLASAGDYRRYFEWQGRRYSHAIDPRTGRPVDHDLVSVSVLAPDATRADAWATALLVLGPEAGPRVATREGLAVLFVLDRGAGLETRATPALEPHDLR